MFCLHSSRRVLLGAFALAVFSVGTSVPLAAQTVYMVTLDTTGLNGLGGQMAFDLTDGDSVSGNNAVAVSAFASDATLTGAGNANVGGASGDLPGSLALTDTAFFNESARGLVFGNAASFMLALSTNFVAPGSPDEFSFFLPDAGGMGSLVSTSDPSGFDTLFTIDMDGTGSGTLTSYAINTPGVHYSVVLQPAATPEPGALALFAGMGLSGAGFLARRRSCRPRA